VCYIFRSLNTSRVDIKDAIVLNAFVSPSVRPEYFRHESVNRKQEWMRGLTLC